MKTFFRAVVSCIAISISISNLIAQTASPCQQQPFAVITVAGDFVLNGQGQNVDAIGFWIAPDVTNSLMFVSSKANFLVEVWKYPFKNNEQLPLTHSTFSSSNVNGVVVDQEADLLYISIGDPANTVSVFNLPQLDFVMNFNKSGANYKTEPNLALLKLANGEKRIYVSADDIVYIHDAATGAYINEFTPSKGLENMAGDPYYQVLYIPDENHRTGIYAYDANGNPYQQGGTNNFGGNGVFQSDAEGILVYTCPIDGSGDDGTGLIVVSDQISTQTEFEFFDRQTWEHLGSMKINGVSNTDGIGSVQTAFPDYPMGIFAAINDDGTTVVVGWDVILEALGYTPAPLSAPQNLRVEK